MVYVSFVGCVSQQQYRIRIDDVGMRRLGIDLGGTKISAIVLGGAAVAGEGSDDVLAYQRLPTPQGDYPATLKAIQRLVSQMETQVGKIDRVGIGTPGSPSPIDEKMRNCNSTCLNGQWLQRDIEQLLQRPVTLANDADCLALSEAYDGMAAEAQSVFAVILGTGVGGALVVNRQIVQGPNRITGEWGHNPLPAVVTTKFPNYGCYCGQSNCIETLLSGQGLQRVYASCGPLNDSVNGSANDSELVARPALLSAQQIAHLAQDNDSQASCAIQNYADIAAQSLAVVINIIDPDVIVLGGGLGQIKQLPEFIVAALPAYIFSDSVNTTIVTPKHGDDSGVRGAARL